MFSIRSISHSSRYVPSVVTNSSGYNVKIINNRQLSKNVEPGGCTSKFLNEFLGYPVFISKNEINSLLSENLVDTKQRHTFIGIGCLLENKSINNSKLNKLNKPFNLHNKKLPEVENVDFLQKEHIIKPFLLTSKKNEFLTNESHELENKLKRNTNLGLLGNNNSITKEQFLVLSSTSNLTQVNSSHTESLRKDSDSNKNSSEENLEKIFDTLSYDLPRFFVKTMDYTIYHPNIEFVNNIKNVTTKGIFPYVRSLAFLRIAGHVKYAYVKLDILKITKHTQDNTIKVRWRISGIGGMKVILTFWKYKIWNIKEAIKHTQTWHDGFSTFYIGEDGKVFKHVADKMMPDQELLEDEKKKANILKPPKLATPLTFSNLN